MYHSNITVCWQMRLFYMHVNVRKQQRNEDFIIWYGRLLQPVQKMV